MGIRFLCPTCEKKIHVKDHQAGLRGFCPKCGARVEIPMHSTLLSTRRKGTDLGKVRRPGVAPGAAGEYTIMSLLPPVGRLIATAPTGPRDPLVEFPHYQWYVVPVGGTEPFGPADGRLIQQWMREGRIVARSMVWRQDWPEWRKAGTIWSQLLLAESDAAAQSAARSPAAPQFTAPKVPSVGELPSPLPSPAVRNPPAYITSQPAETQLAPRPATIPPSAAAASSAAPYDELYYPHRSHGAYLMMVVLLVAAVVALGVVMFKVIDHMSRERREASSMWMPTASSMRPSLEIALYYPCGACHDVPS